MKVCQGPWAPAGRHLGPQSRPGLFLTGMGLGLFIYIKGYLGLEIITTLGNHLFEI